MKMGSTGSQTSMSDYSLRTAKREEEVWLGERKCGIGAACKVSKAHSKPGGGGTGL